MWDVYVIVFNRETGLWTWARALPSRSRGIKGEWSYRRGRRAGSKQPWCALHWFQGQKPSETRGSPKDRIHLELGGWGRKRPAMPADFHRAPMGRGKVVGTLGAQVFRHQHPWNVNVVCVYFPYSVKRELLAAPYHVKINHGDFSLGVTGSGIERSAGTAGLQFGRQALLCQQRHGRSIWMEWGWGPVAAWAHSGVMNEKGPQHPWGPWKQSPAY